MTLFTPSEYVNRGLAYGLDEWRANDWQWEHFGEMVPVKNRDLWQRIDRALAFHELEWRRFDSPHGGESTSASAAGVRSAPRRTARDGQTVAAACRRWCEDRLRRAYGWVTGEIARRRALVQFE